MNRQLLGQEAPLEAAQSAAAVSVARAALRQHLVNTQRTDGGWSARPAGPSDTESTSLCLLALSFVDEAPFDAAQSRAKEWLRARQRADGSWPHSDQVPLSHWMTSLAVLALGRSEEDRDRALSGARWLLDQEGRGHSWLTRLMFRFFPERKPVELDWDLTGWPWLPDTFSWVEPTSYALIALKSLRPTLSGRAVRARIEEAHSMILDRTCEEGGWNYGNSLVLGEQLWPYPDTTALGLIALQDAERDELIERSLDALRRMAEENDSVLVRSLAVLALDLYGEDVSNRRSELARRLATTAPPVHARATAFAALALDETRRPLEVPREA